MTNSPIDIPRFADHVGSWLASGAPEADVVLSCRVRLARNLAEYSFIPRLEPCAAEEICEKLREALVEARLDRETLFVPMTSASPLLRLMLRERHLISRDLAPSEDGQGAQPGRAVAFGASETLSVMVNEEDHVRLQAIAGGFQLDAAWRRAQEIDRLLEGRCSVATP